jgi:uncharacterized membrane protein YfcA
LPDINLLIVLFGLGVGILVGTTGMGGGSLMTPLLILVFGVKPVVAIGTDLAYAAVTKTVGGWKHFRQGTVDVRLSTWLAFGSIPGALVGVWVLDLIEKAYGASFDTILLLMVAGALLLTGVAVLARALFAPNAHARERASIALERRHKVAAVVMGLVVGFVLGVTSAGSGALIAVGLIALFRLTPHRVVGTDVFHAAILLWVAGGAHFLSGNVDFALAGTILIGSVPGVYIGSRLSVKMPERGLRPALGIVLLASGLGLISKAGGDVDAIVLLGVPLTLALLTYVVYQARSRGHLRRRPRPAPLDPEVT